MKNPAKVIKIVSILLLIGGILACIGGLFMAVGGGAGAALVTENADVVDSQIAEDTEAVSAIDELNNYLGTDAKPSEATAVIFGGLAVVGVLIVIAAIIDIISAIFGLKAAKGGNPKPAFVLGIISVVWAIISLVSSIGTVGVDVVSLLGSVIGLIIPAIYTYAAYLLKKQQA